MKTLWVFGDSMSAPLLKSIHWCNEYIIWKGYTPKVWPEILSDKLNIELVNLAKDSSDNYWILDTISNNIENIKSDDIVFIGWSSIKHFRLIDTNDRFRTFMVNNNFNGLKLESFNYIDDTTIKEIRINRKNEKWKEEFESWEKLIKKSLPTNKVVFWSALDTKPNRFWNELWEGIEKIYEESNGELVNDHFSEKGHQHLAEILLYKLTNKKLII